MDGFQEELLHRLPLAQAALRVFGYALDTTMLQEVFEAHRGHCYEDALRFDQLVYLIRDALAVHHGSGHQAFAAAEAEGQLPVAEANVYGKLARLPLEVSMALLAKGAERLREIMPSGHSAVVWPKSLSAFRAMVFDGKKIKNAAKRLKPLRGLAGRLLGGKLLVALDLFSGLVMAMNADPDGERNDVPLVPGLVEQVRGLVPHPILWIADRQFGNLKVPTLLCARERDHFLVRCVKTLTLERDPRRPARQGVDAEGQKYIEEWGWVGLDRKRRMYVRRITLQRAGEDPIILITDLLDQQAWPAVDLLAAYRQRWGIERVFQQVTEVFQLQTLIGSSPQAMIFQSAMCFLLYDLIQVVRWYLAEDGDQPVERVSSEKLFGDVQIQLNTWKELGDPRVAVRALAFGEGARAATPTAMTGWLKRTLRGTWRSKYIKAPPKRKKPPGSSPPRAKVPHGHGGHSSTWRILQAAKGVVQKEPRS
jgi:hypothetical protein